MQIFQNGGGPYIRCEVVIFIIYWCSSVPEDARFYFLEGTLICFIFNRCCSLHSLVGGELLRSEYLIRKNGSAEWDKRGMAKGMERDVAWWGITNPAGRDSFIQNPKTYRQRNNLLNKSRNIETALSRYTSFIFWKILSDGSRPRFSSFHL